jgi:hypothetical protein
MNDGLNKFSVLIGGFEEFLTDISGGVCVVWGF